MRFRVTGIPYVCVLALLPAVPALSQNSPVANVYVQTHSGVYAYTTSSTGQLTPVRSTPYAVSGQIGAARTSYILSVGTDDLHAYKIESNGAIGSQTGQIDTQSYGGSQCGTPYGPAILDHTGQYFSLELTGASPNNEPCSSLQTYKVSSSGQFTFLGDSVNTWSYHGTASGDAATTYSSNDLFAYGIQGQVYANAMLAYKRASAGDLVADSSFTEKDPAPNPSTNNGNYFPNIVAADNASHLAVLLNQPFGSSETFQLASYSINDTTGAIASSNTWSNMPTLTGYPSAMAVNWAGSVVAVAQVQFGGSQPDTTGIQLYHFNGASPATVFGKLFAPGLAVDQLTWDSSNHLYALSYESQQLYVFNVTSSGAVQAPGSPYKFTGAYGFNGLIVISK